jgi:hypothetical protein
MKHEVNHDTYLTSAEACKILKVCRKTLRAMRRAGLVKAVNIGAGPVQPRWRYVLDLQPDNGNDLNYLDFKRRAGL